jgi:hypothetical protein
MEAVGFSPGTQVRARLNEIRDKGDDVIFLQDAVHQLYFVMSAVVALLLISRLFRRKTRPGLAYDIVYAYAIIPFILRALHVK